MAFTERPHIMLVLARGGTVRNFLYNDFFSTLVDNARVTLLTPFKGHDYLKPYEEKADQVIRLTRYTEKKLPADFRYTISMAHNRWLWSRACQYHWKADYIRASTTRRKLKLLLLKGLALPLANRTVLKYLTGLENELSWHLRPTRDFERLFAGLKPDLVFNCSHIHGQQADLPMRAAYRMCIPTAAFIYSWDNLTSRSRIFVPYNFYLVWTDSIRNHLLGLYPDIASERVYVTGTPQFDFHFKPEYQLGREELCSRIGADPGRPYILYTTGFSKDLPGEHRILEGLIDWLGECSLDPKPELVVRTFIYSDTDELKALSQRDFKDVFFPPVLWDGQFSLPHPEDQLLYTSLLRHASLGVNAASTVSLELMMLDKPVVNLGFEPPGSSLAEWTRFSRHVEYEHYQPVAESGGVMVARSMEDLFDMVERSLREPAADSPARRQFIRDMFGDTLDGRSGVRVADKLLELAQNNRNASITD